MSSGSSALYPVYDGGFGVRAFLRRQAMRGVGLLLLVLVSFCLTSLATWNVADPSFSHATDNPVTNVMGYPGAIYSDIAMQFFGIAAVASLVPAVFWGIILAGAHGLDRPGRRAAAWLAGSLLAAGAAGCISPTATWPLPTGLGGVFGDMVLALPAMAIGDYPSGLLAVAIALLLLVPSAWLLLYGAAVINRAKKAPAAQPEDDFADDDEEDDEGDGQTFLALGVAAHWWLSLKAFWRRRFPAPEVDLPDEFALADPSAAAAARSVDGPARIEPDFDAALDFPPFDASDAPASSEAPARVENPAPRPAPGSRVRREAQTTFLESGEFQLPSLHLLAEPKSTGRDPGLSKDALEQNARLLEGVLEDFGVKGEIIHVRPGPVVTLYELEPAPGIKSSRVIGLADDIARSMSAIAARVAVVPGRNAIGIELPNAKRETVYLRELLASREFETTKARLALSLGKTINGEAVIADLAKMPHLLVAGTTGSGKSVAINTMILSLLYRMSPDQCRLIMIDPKMLELSVYDGIPHLLTPVVTDPKKAVVALKWTVREMEDRYRKMSKVGVRNIEGFNQRVIAAKKKGDTITRTVQTGFDRETGEAIYESETLDLEPMPFIVVIIDEMADLMMVAGKDIEGAVQRLAQMARAAGIHVIMATQRPSVDVITGTIKANFPTRISFQVTSKIDSRTILGEQGAEQLLGMGDMLYMAGGGRVQRVHGPFVSDNEVEQIVAHLKMQGTPAYLEAVTEDDGEDGDSVSGSGAGNLADSNDPYDQAVAVVLRDGKASTSYIQRRLGIGYNRAASIIERMEAEGIVGPANHAGKREILVPTEQDEV
ncbi:DNA translocase FtsK [Chelativorans sp. Marseille-P2723]|uniref:FtsK/SpoIIIE family DNA translocase n=1 Tax=Chelativorans sp. Marseille-P2723 TaxID=2709133 RepID=UPI00156EAA55|nr:DNA translocase FtsK [Chelativorans sp. Marseille-P2723]